MATFGAARSKEEAVALTEGCGVEPTGPGTGGLTYAIIATIVPITAAMAPSAVHRFQPTDLSPRKRECSLIKCPLRIGPPQDCGADIIGAAVHASLRLTPEPSCFWGSSGLPRWSSRLTLGCHRVTVILTATSSTMPHSNWSTRAFTMRRTQSPDCPKDQLAACLFLDVGGVLGRGEQPYCLLGIRHPDLN